jgi:hypothetical protein
MKKQYQLFNCFLLASTMCTAQIKYWASGMRLYPLDSCKRGNIQLSIGVGTSTPTRATKASLNALPTRDLLANVYLPMQVNKPRKHNRFDYGIHLGFTYAVGYGKYGVNNIQPYSINTEIQRPSLVARATGNTGHVIFRAEVGQQFNVRFRNFLISPIISWGFVRLQQGAFEIEQTTLARNAAGLDTTVRFKRYAVGETKKAGMGFFPKLRLNYFMGRLGIWAAGQYTLGPTVNRDVTVFIPQGAANPVTGSYTLNQIRLGNTAGIERERYNYQSWGIGLGLTWKIPQRCAKPRSNCGCT